MTSNGKKNLSFEQLPQVVAELSENVKVLQATMASLVSKVGITPFTENQVSNNYQHELCNIDRACAITKKAKSTLYALARKGDMPCIKKGKCWYFFEDELMNWMEQGRRNHSYRSEDILHQIRSGIHHKPKTIQ